MKWLSLCFSLSVAACGASTASPAFSATSDPQGAVFFESRVRPVLAQRCYSCHSSAATPLQAGLTLDSASGWVKGGRSGPVVKPGDPEHSLLIQAISYTGSLRMPPSGKLPAAEIQALTRWVRLGAPAPLARSAASRRIIDLKKEGKHWAFQPLQRIARPVVRESAAERAAGFRISSPIDGFILRKLRQRGMAPNPPASRRTLIRRLSFDLTGLPPTTEEINAFQNDRRPGAYLRLIDRLLASPHYGERWGRHWLDLARYADSHGFEQDYDRPYAYQYRDFVTRALNEDMPYDRFVRWQLAGDEISPENPQALMATGFLAAGVHSTQITKSQVEKERYDELDDMLATTGTAMLGLTIGCARCHDHKYDPIPTRDYYRMLSTFTTTVRSDMEIVVDPSGYRRVRRIFDADQLRLEDELGRYEKNELPERTTAWVRNRPTMPAPPAWIVPELASAESVGDANLVPQPDGSIRATGKNPDYDTYRLKLRTRLTGITAVRLEALSDPTLPHGGPGRAANGNFALTDVRLAEAPVGHPLNVQPIKLVSARATVEQAGLPVRAAIDGDPKSAWAVDPQFGRDQAAVFGLEKPAGYASGTVLALVLKFENNTGHNLGRLRVAISQTPSEAAPLSETPADEALSTVFRTLRKQRDSLAAPVLSRAELSVLSQWYRYRDVGWRDRQRNAKEHLARAPRPATEKALICSEGVSAVRLNTQGEDFFPVTYQLRRGDPSQKMGIVSQGFLQVLMRTPLQEKAWQEKPPPGWRTSYRRRSLANWMVDTDAGAGALLARVIVNRVWQHHMGRGIVGTPSDFGTQGDPPSHPQLLDWLAGEFIHPVDGHDPYACGWRIKRLHRLILNSATYRQSAAVPPDKLRLDPDNALCSRHSRVRLEAEAIRDAMLSTSGLLDPVMFGPGTLDEGQTRRSLYFATKRSGLIPSMRLFDAPDSLQGIPGRQATTVAPQALMLLNNGNVRTWARAFARRVRSVSGLGVGAVVNRAYLLALSRPPDTEEMSGSVDFLRRQAALYRKRGAPDPDLSALTDYCQALFGLNEFIYID